MGGVLKTKFKYSNHLSFSLDGGTKEHKDPSLSIETTYNAREELEPVLFLQVQL